MIRLTTRSLAFALAFPPVVGISAVARAAPVAVDVRGADGKPLLGAIVSVESPRIGGAPVRGPYAVEQRDIAFQPRMLIVPVGASVTFPNRDRVRHHVYSFSSPKKFDLKLYGREDTRSVVFDKPGVVALGCNIHDSMSGIVYVTATPFAEQVDGSGHARFDGVPAGAVTIRVWHPSIRSRDNSLAQSVTVPAAGFATTVSIAR
ncbi:methylamine utilization protein [Sphingomonas sp.]|jgi:plastocyanin|uniref:methylamine utilization protein n=1 Tax=Sphingomonas sp. TaxID=28214 RepID=UPI002ED8FD50